MKIKNTSALKMTLVALICATLTATSLRAQSYTGEAGVTIVRPSIKTAIWTVANSASVRMSFEKQGPGKVHVRLCNSKGDVLYEHYESAPTFMAKYDLSQLAAGVYTLSLEHAGDQVSQSISFNAPQPEPAPVALLKVVGADSGFVTIK